jgi:hypothetical protein
MIIGSAQNLKQKVRDSPVMLNGKTIPSTDSFECLGVIIDKRLLWDKHIEKIFKKVGAGIAVMKRIKPFVPIETMRLIYNALIQPCFDYCSPLWDNCCAYLKEKLQKLQNHAARIIAGASYEIPSADVLETLGWEALEVRRKSNKAILMYRILNNQGASSLKESFTRISALVINYNLRNSSTDLVLPHPKREFLQNSFKFSGAKLWNSLPLQAKLAQSEYTFKMNINSLDTQLTYFFLIL